MWLKIGIEKVDTYEGVTVKVLLDSGATEMFVDKKFVEKNVSQIVTYLVCD